MSVRGWLRMTWHCLWHGHRSYRSWRGGRLEYVRCFHCGVNFWSAR